VKVSAPLPPPPPPVPVASADAAVTVSPADPASPPAPPKVATWPEWHGAVDKSLYAIVLLTACLVGMFVAKNSDIWRHLATGRLLVQGKYTPGSDPLSYTGESRAWVNPNLIFEPIAYAIYSADRTGAALVAVKALIFGAVFMVLFQLRRKESSLWPWCVFGALGVLACAPQATLRPQVFGMFFLALALFTLFRSDWTTHRWRKPLLYGGLVALWANVDSSSFLGPLLVLLLLIGEWVQKRFLDSTDSSENAILPPPPIAALARALPLAIAGWLLNPSLLLALLKSPGEALGQLFPAELTFGYRAIVAGDLELERTLSLSAFVGEYAKTEGFGSNANGLAALLLLIFSGLLLITKFRMSHVLLWIAFAFLPLAHYRWIPFFAILAVPLAAAYSNNLSTYFRLCTTDDQRTKIFILTSGIGRLFSIFAALALFLAAIPGWLHPRVSDDPSTLRRVDWGMESDVGAKRAGELIQHWRSNGDLPNDVKLLLAYPDFGDYCAWFAPNEKVFANTRYQFHRPELPDLMAIRRELQNERPRGELRAIAIRHSAGGIVLCGRDKRFDISSYVRAIDGLGVWSGEGEKSFPDWPGDLWAVDGRMAIIGRTDTVEYRAIDKKIHFNPARSAFGPQTSAVADGSSGTSAPAITDNILSQFLARPNATAVESDDAATFVDIARHRTQIRDLPWQVNIYHGSYALGGGWVSDWRSKVPFDLNRRPPADEELAYELLALRAARTGAAKNPDDPMSYRALAVASQLRYYSISQFREPGLIPLTSYVRELSRITRPDEPRDRYTRLAVYDGLDLFSLQVKLNQWDLALQTINDVLERMGKLQPREIPPPQFLEFYWPKLFQLSGAQWPTLLAPGEKREALQTKGPDWVKKKFEEVRDETKKLFAQRNEIFTTRLKSGQPSNRDPFGSGKLSLVEQFILAGWLGLPQKALDLIPDDLRELKPSDFEIRFRQPRNEQDMYLLQAFIKPNQYLVELPARLNRSPVSADLRLQTIDKMLQTGKVEMAAEHLKAMETELDKHTAEQANDPNLPVWRNAVSEMRAEEAWLVGNFKKSGEYLHERIRALPKVTQADLSTAVAEILGTMLAASVKLEFEVNSNKALTVLRNLQNESRLFYEQGLFALQAGDIPHAREYFAKSLKPQGVPLEKLGVPREEPQRMFAERYLKLIAQYAEKQP
jgi:hypothetical protein